MFRVVVISIASRVFTAALPLTQAATLSDDMKIPFVRMADFVASQDSYVANRVGVELVALGIVVPGYINVTRLLDFFGLAERGSKERLQIFR